MIYRAPMNGDGSTFGEQPTQQEKARTFRSLHERDAFIIPNPWDAGSAVVLEGLGFQALATTSSGFAFTRGRRDGGAALDEVIEHIRILDRATRLPVSADLQNGFGAAPEAAADAIRRAAEAGAVGGSIEDYDPEGHIYGFDQAVERIEAASEAANDFGFPFMLTARAENYLHGNPDLEDTISRLQAYERAGAGVLFAPGLRSGDEIRAVCENVSKPLNVLAGPQSSLSEIADAGARRISVGGGLTWVAAAALVDAAERMRDEGDFSALDVPTDFKKWLA